MARIALCVVLVWALASNHCVAQSVQLEPLTTITERAGGPFYFISDVAVADDGRIFVTDRSTFEVCAFTSAGELEACAGRQGEGPGEFLRGPRSVLSLGKEIIVFDINVRNAGLVFDQYLDFVERIDMRGANHPAIDDNGSIFLNYHDFRSGTYLHKYSLDTRSITHIELADLHEYIQLNTFSIIPPGPNTNMMLVYNNMNRIDVLDAGFNLIRRHEIDGLPSTSEIHALPNLDEHVRRFSREEQDFARRSGYTPVTTIFTHAVLDPHGRLFIQGGDYSEHRARTVYVLSQEGELLRTFLLPDGEELVDIDKNGHLYTVASRTRDVVRKYRLRIDP